MSNTFLFPMRQIRKDTDKMRHVFIMLQTQDGEHQYNHPMVKMVPPNVNLQKWADKYCSTFWGDEKAQRNDLGYWECFGCTLAVIVKDVRPITEMEYNILSKFLNV